MTAFLLTGKKGERGNKQRTGYHGRTSDLCNLCRAFPSCRWSSISETGGGVAGRKDPNRGQQGKYGSVDGRQDRFQPGAEVKRNHVGIKKSLQDLFESSPPGTVFDQT